MTTIKLRPYQDTAEDAARVAMRSYKRVLIVLPTGGGKTVIFTDIASKASSRGKRIVILAHRQELIHQISKSLSNFKVEHGIISPQFSPDYRKRVQVASIATLNARFKKIPPQFMNFDMMILDEAHHLLATNTFGKVYDLLGQPLLLGVTATPERADGRGLGEGHGGVFQHMVEGVTVRFLIDNGFLSDFVVYAPKTKLDLSGIKTAMGDYDKGALADAIDKPMITGDAVREYSRLCPGAPAVVFCVSIKHCEHVAAEFQAAGHDFRVIDGSMSDVERKALINGLGKSVTGLVSCDVVSEGTDIGAIACAIFLRPTKSMGLYIQQAGRALRPVYGEGYDLSTREGRLAALANGPKPRAFILDHAGNTLQHGMIDEEREWSLEGRKKGKKKKKDEEPVIKVKQCETCFTVHAPAPVCPSCGHVYEVQSRKIEQVDGELQEVTPQMREQMRKQRMREVSGAKTLEDLERIEAERGYRRGWAKHVHNSRGRRAA